MTVTLTHGAVHVDGGVRLPYVRQGERGAPAVLCLHGLSDAWTSFAPVLAHLPADLDVVALTQRGHGDADRPDGDYGVDRLAADAIEALDDLGIERAVIVGHSLGAFVAQTAAAAAPGRVGGLVLAGAIGSPRDSAAVTELTHAVQALTDPVDPAFARDFQVSTTATPIDEQLLDGFVAESLKLPVRVWQALADAMRRVDLDAVQARVIAPALVVWGERDAYTDPREQQRHLRQIAGARLLTYEGTGHAVHWEHPRRFAADVAAFVREVAGR